MSFPHRHHLLVEAPEIGLFRPGEFLRPAGVAGDLVDPERLGEGLEGVVDEAHEPLQRMGPVRPMNRPGFTGECFVQMSGNFIKVVHVFIEGLLCFLRCDVANGAVQALGVVPVDPFQGFPFDPTDGFPGAQKVDDFGFEQTNRAFGQRIIV